MDETACALDPPLARCWMKRGTQTTVPATAGATTMLHVSGAIDLISGTVLSTFANVRNSTAFIAFLEHLMQHSDPNKTIYLVLDNASFHTSYAAQAAMALYEPRLQLFWLPKCTPQLNPIERFWRHLKQRAYANHHLDNLHDIRHQLERVLHQQNQTDAHNRYHLLI